MERPKKFYPVDGIDDDELDFEPENDPFLQMLIDYENENEERYGFKSYNDMRAWANGYDDFRRHDDDEWKEVEYEYDPYSFEAQMYGGYDF